MASNTQGQSEQNVQNSPNQHLQSAENVQNFNQMMETITTLMTQNTIMLNVMPDFSKTIEDFTGESGPQEAKLWLKQLEST